MRIIEWVSATDLNQIWNEITHAVDGLSVPIAIIAVVVAIWSGIHARRSASAAEVSASAAQSQADAAARQAISAQQQVSSALDANRVVMLLSERERVDRDSADAVLLIDAFDRLTRIDYEGIGRLAVPHPEEVKPSGAVKLTRSEHWSADIYFLVYGTLVNHSDRCIRVALHGSVNFIEGRHPQTAEPTALPVETYPGARMYVLFPGQAARFEWVAWRQLEEWIEAALGKEKRSMGAEFVILPGGYGTRQTCLRLELEGKLFTGRHDTDQDEWKVPASCNLQLTTQMTRQYVTSAEHIEAELFGDEAARSRLILRDMVTGAARSVAK